MKWFRWYQGTVEDTKFRIVARNASVTLSTVIAVWAFILEEASKESHRGICLRNEEYLFAVLDEKPQTILAVLTSMEEAGLIKYENKIITVTRWKERQYETDTTDPTNAERQRRFRERKRAENGDETPRNGSVTVEKRPDTDTDTDTEKKEELYAQDFEIFFSNFPRQRRGNKGKAFTAYKKARTRAEMLEIHTGLQAYIDSDEVKRGFAKGAAAWLNDDRWSSEYGKSGTQKLSAREQMRRVTPGMT